MLPNYVVFDCEFVGFIFKKGGLLFFMLESGKQASERLKMLDKSRAELDLTDLSFVPINADEELCAFLKRESDYRANDLPVDARRIREALEAQA